ncbi:iron complex outermembrane recepter protein [Duganella sp. CF402]|uniref:TonB-dependent receptor n=1 Tax=unclassified Duganella TaxID=2636909 RepID=UPI0008BB7E9D|nr:MULTISPECIES: TonB-dependent receptor [unclassified Duganella]RZT08201.1 iron complex outermembrane receptor protein [Duganella sp. BK701]SEM02386.1 iron complex outermembrane recepter protein [Duganella sp. CF402]
MQYKRMLRFLLASGALLISGQTVFAQVAPPVEGGPDAGQNVAAPTKAEDAIVVVTANRVRTNAQTTAVSLNVYNATALADAGVHNVQALQTIDPSINVTSATGAAYVAIRGIASTDVTEIGDPAVPIARDGFFTNRSFSIAASMYDVERVEVLKGPQGTLFGRNSTGGLINIITAKPSERLGGYLSAEFGNYNARNLEGAVNVPVSDKVQLRFSAVSRQHDGYRTITGINTGINIKGDDEDTKSARLQLAFQPVAGFEGLVSYQKDKVDAVGDTTTMRPIASVSPIGDAKAFPGWAPVFTKLDGERLRWEFSYDRMPWDLTLTYAGGYDTQEYAHSLDTTGPAYPGARQFLQAEHPNTHNHEIRIATPLKGRFTAQAGYFYFTEKNVIDSGVRVVTMDPGLPTTYVNNYGIKFDYLVNTKTEGLFSQVGMNVKDDLKLTLGVRHSRDEKTRAGQAKLLLGALVSPFIGAPPITNVGNGQMEDSKTTYLVGMDWTLSPTNFLYAKYATGYKAGGFNSNGSAASVPYDSEAVKSFEIGSKNQFIGRKVKFNAALFYQDYANYQASQSSNVLSSGNGIFNVGKATIKGLETELVANIPDMARFDVNATFLDATFGNGIVVRDGATPPVLRNIGGNDLPNAPKYVITTGVQRTFDLGSGELMARLSAKHSSKFYYTVFNDKDTYSPSYTTINALLSFKPNDAEWEVQLFGNNVTDKVVIANSQRNYVGQVNTLQFQPPRTFGVRLRYNF